MTEGKVGSVRRAFRFLATFECRRRRLSVPVRLARHVYVASFSFYRISSPTSSPREAIEKSRYSRRTRPSPATRSFSGRIGSRCCFRTISNKIQTNRNRIKPIKIEFEVESVRQEIAGGTRVHCVKHFAQLVS